MLTFLLSNLAESDNPEKVSFSLTNCRGAIYPLRTFNSDSGGNRFGHTEDGRPGWKEPGADTVISFSNVPDITIYGYVSGDETDSSAPSAIQIPVGVYKKIKYASGSYATMYANGYSNGDIMHSFSGSSRGTATTGTLIPADVNFIRFAQGHGRAGYVVLTAVV